MDTPDVWTSEVWTRWLTICKAMGIHLPEIVQLENQLKHLYKLLDEANKSSNLTRINDPETFLYRHILDSLTLLPHLPSNASIADVGSGAGFPSLALSLANPSLHITAIEATEKKALFIETAAEALGLTKRIHIINERAETLGHQTAYREKFDRVVARAVAPLPVLLELCLPLTHTNGYFIAMKGTQGKIELNNSENALFSLGGQLKKAELFEQAPFQGACLYIFEKHQATPIKYPRRPGKPNKSPL